MECGSLPVNYNQLMITSAVNLFRNSVTHYETTYNAFNTEHYWTTEQVNNRASTIIMYSKHQLFHMSTCTVTLHVLT